MCPQAEKENNTDNLARDEGSRGDAVDHDSRTSEAIGGDVGVRDHQVRDGPDACVRRGSEEESDEGEQRLANGAFMRRRQDFRKRKEHC